ncbi:hypothetical protein [Streptomyces physcomitrii]|nr:hypothetical protein [Streptomyces physcomitrii]
MKEFTSRLGDARIPDSQGRLVGAAAWQARKVIRTCGEFLHP